MGSDVAIHVLGSTRAAVAGAPADLGGPRQRAVVARLVVEGGRVVSADRLVDDLWDGEPPPKALAALQVHVSHLRRSLEPDRAPRQPATVLVSAPPGYALRLPRTAVDAWRFEDLLAGAGALADPRQRRARLAEALACWAGPALAEALDTAWAGPEAARLEELRRSAVERAAAADLDAGEVGRAVADLERHVHHHPAREEAVRLLALGLYRSGRQGDALAALRSVRDHLAEELGVDPSPALRALEADVLAQSPSLEGPAPRAAVAVAAPVAEPPPATAPSSPLAPLAPLAPTAPTGGAVADGAGQDDDALGREREVAAVLTAGDEARRAGAARLVWLAGEAGDGKTTVLSSAVAAAAAQGWTTTWGRCPEVDGAPPGWAWQEVLDDVGGGELADLASSSSPFLLARAVARELAQRTREAPVLVVLDDVHRGDGLTLQLLRQVVDHLDEAPVLVVAAYRPSESTAELAAARAALAAATAGHVQLAGLERGAVAALARRSGLVGPIGTAEPDPALVDLLVARTGGRPLFVRELARLLAARGQEVVRGLVAGRSEVSVPAGVADVLRARLARLPASSATALRQAAVLGRTVDVEVLAGLAGRGDDDLLDALEAPVLAGLLDEPAPGSVRFTHALVRDVLYEDTPAMRRTRLHAAAVGVYERLAPHDVGALAHHAGASLSAATAERALGHLLAAARSALAVGATDEAARLYRAVLRAVDLLPAGHAAAGDDERALLLSEAVTAHARAGDAVGGRELQEQAVVRARASGRRDLLVAAVTAWRTPLVWSVRQQDEPSARVLGALRELLADPDPALGGAVRVRLLVGVFLEVEGWDVEAELACSAEAVDLARQLLAGPGGDDPEVVSAALAALNARAYAALGPQLRDQRAALASELVDLAHRAGATDHHATGQWLVFLAAAAVGDMPGAERAVRAALELCATGQLSQLLGVLGIWRGVVDVLAGRLAEGEARYTSTAYELAERGGANAEVMAVIGRFVAAWARGDLAPVVEEVTAVNTASRSGFGPAATLALIDAGREDEARATHHHGVPPGGYFWLGMTVLWAHACARLGDREGARTAYAELLPWAGRIGGIDAGTMPVGPVDDALAACAALLGDAASAQRHRRDGRQVEASLRASLAEAGLL